MKAKERQEPVTGQRGHDNEMHCGIPDWILDQKGTFVEKLVEPK